MRTIWTLLAAVAPLCAGVAARAQDAAGPTTLDAVQVAAAELPPGVRLVPGLRCATQAAQELFADPGFVGSLDCPPDRKAFQSFQTEGGAAGAVLVFEYAGAVPPFMRRVVERSLWGQGGPSKERPDGCVAAGRLLFVFSFPYGDPAGEWTKERLRKKFRVPALRTRPELDDLRRKLWSSVEKDARGGLDALAASGVDLAAWSLGSYLQGECAMSVSEHAAAEAAYRRARESHRTFVDPMAPNLAWAALDGVGNALLEQKKFADAAKVLAESLAEGRALRLENDDTPHTSWSLACAYAGLGRWPQAHDALTDAVDGDKRWLALAKKSDLLDAARKRPEFRVLLDLDPPPRPAAPPKLPAAADAAPEAKFDDLLVQPTELPAGWSLVPGVRCASTSAAEFYAWPDPMRISRNHRMPVDGFPATAAPARKACQSIVRPDGAVGSVLLFEYAAAVDPLVVEFFKSYCWGAPAGPTNRYPEEVFKDGRRLWIFSFPRGDAACEWAKDRLRARFKLPVPRTRLDLAPTLRRLLAVHDGHDADLGLRLCDARAARLADSAAAWYLRGEFAVGKGDHASAEAAYRRAVALHDALVDPLDERTLWSALDGLGGSLLFVKKPEEARATLVRAKAFAASRGLEDVATTPYNLACALARLQRFEESLAELKAAIGASPRMKAAAREDADFAEARKRPDFQELLGK